MTNMLISQARQVLEVAPPVVGPPVGAYQHFSWSGDGGGTRQLQVGFEPDFVMVKCKSNASTEFYWWDRHFTFGQHFQPSVELGGIVNDANGIQATHSNGFTVGSTFNASGRTYSSWSAGLGVSPVVNNDGAIQSTVYSMPTIGLSIVEFTGSGSISTVGHGLGAVPTMIWTKDESASYAIYSEPAVDALGLGFFRLSTTTYQNNASSYEQKADASLVYVSGGGSHINQLGASNHMLCWTDVDDVFQARHYVGNGNVNGPTITYGFPPAIVLTKGDYSPTNLLWHTAENDLADLPRMDNRIRWDSNATEDVDGTNELTRTATGHQPTTTQNNLNRNGIDYMCNAWNYQGAPAHT